MLRDLIVLDRREAVRLGVAERLMRIRLGLWIWHRLRNGLWSGRLGRLLHRGRLYMRLDGHLRLRGRLWLRGRFGYRGLVGLNGGRFRRRRSATVAVEKGRVIAGIRRDFGIFGLLRHLAPSGTERLFLLALDHFLGHSVLALQLEMLSDGIVEYAHRAEPYRGREDGSGTSARAGSRLLSPLL